MNFSQFIFLSFFILSLPSRAQDLRAKILTDNIEKLICQEWFLENNQEANSEKPTILKQLSFLSRVFLLPQTVVQLGVLAPEKKENAYKVSFQQFFNETDYSISLYSIGSKDKVREIQNLDGEIYKEYQSHLNDYTQLKKKIKRKLKTYTDINQCLVELDKENLKLDDFKKHFIYLTNESNITHFNKFELWKSQDEFMTFSQQGIKQQFTDNEYEIFNLEHEELIRSLKHQSDSIAIMVFHSSSEGKIYDSSFNLLPHQSLQKINSSVEYLIVYSCHMDEVIKRYHLDQLPEKGLTVIYPVVNPKLKWNSAFSANQVPANYFSYFIKKSKKLIKKNGFKNDINQNADVKPNFKCGFEFNLNELNGGEIGVLLNNELIGKVSSATKKISFDCNILSKNNIMTLQRINLYQEILFKQPIDESDLSFTYPILSGDNSNQFLSESLKIKHQFNAEDNYVGGKLLFDFNLPD